MIYLVFGLLAAAALAPLLLSLWREGAVRGRREADLALYRAQLAELDRDRDEGRITAAEHAAATAETGRRLIAAAEAQEDAAPRGRTMPVVLSCLLVPAAALTLYLAAGSPGMPAAPFAQVQAEREVEARLVAELRARLLRMDPHSEQTRTGWLLLGDTERTRGNLEAAAEAYKAALLVRFDPEVAFRAGTLLMAARGEVTEETRDLYRRALEAAPPDARWRPMAERLLATP
jgi:cytochrome c-type biogenesis protein CcmH